MRATVLQVLTPRLGTAGVTHLFLPLLKGYKVTILNESIIKAKYNETLLYF